MKIIQYILLVCSLCLFDEIGAQNRSIEFREGNWEQMLKMAKKEKKTDINMLVRIEKREENDICRLLHLLVWSL